MQTAVDLRLAQQLGMLSLDALEFDCDLLPRCHVGSQVDIAKATRTYLAAQPVLLPYSQLVHSY